VSINGLNYADAVRLITAGRRAERRKKATQGCITGLCVSILGALWGGWMLMIAVGVAHSGWLPNLPTIGYWTAVLIVALLRGVFSSSRPSAQEN